MALPAGISPATWRFEAARSNSLSYGSMKWGRRRDSHSRGADCPAVYETAAVAAEPRRHEMVGCHGLAPCSVRVRAGASLSKFAAQSRDTKAELNRRSQVCEVLSGTGVRVA